MERNDKKISIIIPTRNEERNIKRCMESIKRSTYKNVEVIVVDQESTDKTTDIAKIYNAKVINAPQPNRYVPPSNSRNIGFKESNGDYIYHLDADMELDPGLLQNIIDIFMNEDIVAIVVPEEDDPENIWAKAKAFERSLYANTDMEAARVSRRSIFKNIMYDTTVLSGEDWNIDSEFRKSGNITRTNTGVKHHLGKISLKKEFKKKEHYGTASNTYIKKNKKGLAEKFIYLAKLYFVAIIKNLLKDPITVMAFLILRAVDTIALFGGLILNKISTNTHENRS